MDDLTYTSNLLTASYYLINGKWNLALLHFSNLMADKSHPTATFGFLISFGNVYKIKKLAELQPSFMYLFTKDAINNPMPEQERFYLLAEKMYTERLIDAAIDIVFLADEYGDFFKPAFYLAFKLKSEQIREVEFTVFRNDKPNNYTKPVAKTKTELKQYISMPKYYSEAEEIFHKKLQTLFNSYLVLVNFDVFRVFNTDDILRNIERESYQYFALSEVDFLIVESDTFTPSLGLELDSRYHDDSEYHRINDIRKNIIFSQGGLPLIRIRSFLNRFPNNLEKRLAYHLLRNKINFFVHEYETKLYV